MGKGEGIASSIKPEDLEEIKADAEAWRLALGFTELAAVKCAVELGVADEVERRGGAATLSELSAALGCSAPLLYRVMRFLVQRGVFKARAGDGRAATTYLQTPLSRRLVRGGEKSMAALVLFESTTTMLAPWLRLSGRVSSKGASVPPFAATHGEDVWAYAAHNPDHGKLLDEAMACDARLAAAAVVTGSPDVFEGVEVLVDVGGGNGTFLGSVVKAFPSIKGINFDLPHVVAAAPSWDGVEHVGGDMFGSVPKADAVVLLKVIHDWSDSECVQILKKCREAISDHEHDAGNDNSSEAKPKKKKKVIILEAVIDDDINDQELEQQPELDKAGWNAVKLSLDMAMMAHTNAGKERTRSEWAHIIGEAGFASFSIKPTATVQSVIEAFP